jgi:peptidoglycan/LPS O-acetylase OafA/YrhL
MVIIHHLYKLPLFPFFGIEIMSLGKAGVIFFVFISGALLYLSKNEFRGSADILKFYYRRALRIYPALWLSILMAIIFYPDGLKQQTLESMIVQLTGTIVYNKTVYGMYAVLYNQMAWFVGLIVPFYIAYPLILKFIKKSPYITLFISIFITAFITVYFHRSINIGTPETYVMYFVFGVFVAHKDLYTKAINSDKNIIFLSDLAFYMFLTNMIIIGHLGYNTVMFFIALPIYSFVLMKADKMVKSKIDYIANVLYSYVTTKKSSAIY